MLRHRCPPAISTVMSTFAALAILPCTSAAETTDVDRRSIAAVGGVLLPAFNDARTEYVAGLRVTLPASRIMLVEPGVTFMFFGKDEYGTSGSVMIPELQVQAEVGERVRPFVGLGGEAAVACSDICESAIMLSAGAGVRASFSSGWGGRAELRLRAFYVPIPSATEFTIGLSRAF
ncbi:MAG TPA: hypothetical protein VFJ96_03490 [Gemmatimonadaceae bacterium]|nr:hypothetical protein [Gemmatimonadaceae bacterium]